MGTGEIVAALGAAIERIQKSRRRLAAVAKENAGRENASSIPRSPNKKGWKKPTARPKSPA
jgi:hypothetical protein